MSEQPVEKSDIVKGTPFDDIAKDIDNTVTSLTKFDKGLKDLATTMNSEVKTAMTNTLKGIDAINEAEKQSKINLEKKMETEKSIDTLEKKRVTVRNARIKHMDDFEKKLKKVEAAEKKAAETAKKAADKAIKAEQKLTKAREKARDPLKRLVRLTKEAKLHTQRLALTQGKNSERTQIARKRYEQLDNKMKQLNATTKNGRKSLTQLINTNGKLGLSFSNLSRIAGQFGLALGGATLIRGTISTLVDFDEKVADVAKTTNLSTDAARKLSQELLKIDTRTSITALQELASAGGRLGLTLEKDIIGFATAADKVFVALGDDLGGSAEEIATNLGKISSLFGLEKEFGIEGGIERVGSGLNKISAESKASAGAIQNFTQRMGGLASVLELADVQALGALFDETGQSIEVAASTMTKLLPALASDFKRFADVAGVAPEEFKKIAEEAPIEALKLVATGAKSSEKGLFGLTDVIKSFGVDSARATGIVGVLTDNVERLGDIQDIANEAISENSSIAEENKTKQETLAATWEKLGNRIKAFILGSEGATKFSNTLKRALTFLAKNLETVVKVLWEAIKLYVIYKTVTSKAGKAIGEFVKELIKANGNIIKASKNMKKASEGMTDGAKSAKAFGSALKSIGFAIVISLVLELAQAWFQVAFQTKQAEDFARRYADGLNKGSEQASERLDKLNQRIQEQTNNILLAAKADKERAKAAGASAAELKKIDDEAQKSIDALTLSKQNQLSLDISRVSEEKIAAQESLDALKARRQAVIDGGTAIASASSDVIGLLTILRTASKLTGGAGKTDLELLNEAIEKQAALVGRTTGILNVYRGSLREVQQVVIDNVLAGEDLNDTIIEYQSLLRQIEDEQIKRIADNETREIRVAQVSAQRRIEDLKATQAAELAKLNSDEETKKVKLFQAKELAQLELEIATNLEIGITKIQSKFAKERSDKKFAALEARTKTENEIIQNRLDFQAEMQEGHTNDALDEATRLAEETGKIQLEQFEAELALEKERRKMIIDRNLFEAIDNAKTKEDIQKADEEHWMALQRLDKEFSDKSTEGSEQVAEAAKQSNEEAKKEELKTFIDLEQAITDALADQIDKRIALKDKEIDAAKSAQDFLRELAANGNIEAKESIKAQIDLEREAQKERDELERRKANLLLISQAVQTYTKQIEGGAKPLDALTTTAISTTALTGLLSGLVNFFAVGTMDAPEGMAVVDEKGAEIITDKKGRLKSLGTDSGARRTYLNAGDKVYTAMQSSKMMEEVQNVESRPFNGGGVDNSRVDEQISLLREIKNKPVPDIRLGDVTRTAMEIVETKTKGGLKTVNTFKVKAQ